MIGTLQTSERAGATSPLRPVRGCDAYGLGGVAASQTRSKLSM